MQKLHKLEINKKKRGEEEKLCIAVTEKFPHPK